MATRTRPTTPTPSRPPATNSASCASSSSSKNVVSIPGTEEAEVKQAPAYKAWNFAYINIPGAYEKGLPSIYYISPPDPTWSKEKQEAYIPGRAGLLFTTAHEVYPGHFVQFLHAHRAHSEIGQLFVGYALRRRLGPLLRRNDVREWASATATPKCTSARLQEALLRNVRFLSAIGLHTQGMTVDESKRMFREKAFQDEGNAEQQALRGTFDPAYLNYTLGKLMIRKLRDDWCATRGGKKAWKEFHDEFLKYGGPPIPLIRRAMMGPDDKGSLFYSSPLERPSASRHGNQFFTPAITDATVGLNEIPSAIRVIVVNRGQKQSVSRVADSSTSNHHCRDHSHHSARRLRHARSPQPAARRCRLPKVCRHN